MGKEHIFFYNVILEDFFFIKKGLWVMGRVRCVWVSFFRVCARALWGLLGALFCVEPRVGGPCTTVLKVSY